MGGSVYGTRKRWLKTGSVGHDGIAKMWDMGLGTLIREVPQPSECATGYKVRSVRCTPLGNGSNLVFVAAYNAISLTSKRKSFLALWAYSREKQALRTVIVRSTGRGDGVSSLCVSSCGNFTGVGSMGGSVYIFDTHEMKELIAFKVKEFQYVKDCFKEAMKLSRHLFGLC
ncbi:hypothetical protein TELCIR_06352 [Teladorsagia circumcincta]|uniref:WD domain, G-beta repeat protein n=1 Tax=Teladorsagia circumcincta TaxID=45464 RepID=A0A2G9UNK7_TELCI|nr:hypothetical protein TELCIR_06352 [Teladorsagia circumcincta]